MVKNFDLDIPEISISNKKVFSFFDDASNKVELSFTGKKNANGELPLTFHENLGLKGTVATMSYKKIGRKLTKKISLIGGLDFFFKYNKASGYFDAKRDLISPSGNEYSIYDMSMRKFYAELIDVLKLRLVLGYIESEDKKQPVENYFRGAHKYILMNKYNLRLDECMDFLRGVVTKSYIPEEFFDGFLSEFRKSMYDGELSNSESLVIVTMAKLSLMNEKNAKTSFDDISLHKRVLNEIRRIENDRQFNMIKLNELVKSNSI